MRRPISGTKRLKAWVVSLALILVAMVCLSLLFVLVAQWMVTGEPVQAVSAAAGQPGYVSIQADERLFTMMAALNAAGYDRENNEKGMHPVRQQVRARLGSTSIPSFPGLRRQLLFRPLLGGAFRIHESKYVEWVLQRSDPPVLARAVEGWWVTGSPPFLFLGLDESLRNFYREANIAGLWRESQPQYEAEVERYRTLADPAVQQVLAYLRMPPPSNTRVIVLPNLLDAYWAGYGEQVGNISYLVIGPAEQPNVGEIRHEAMHPLLNPLIDANLQVVDPGVRDRLVARMKPRLGPKNYPDFGSMMHENVIRAIEVQLLDAARREKTVAQEEADGFILVRLLAARLQTYEESGLAFRDYLPVLLQSLNEFEPTLTHDE